MAGEKGTTVNEKMTAIANKIRSKTGGTDSLTLDGMASGVEEVYDKGYDKGILAMWDAATKKGKIISGVCFFNQGLYDDIEKLPYPLTPTSSCEQMFYNYSGVILPRPQYVDLSKVPIDANVSYMFCYCGASNKGQVTVPDYGLPAMNAYLYTFLHATGIKSIEIVRVSEKTTFSNSFSGCTYLTDITFEGVIGQNISFSSCPLTVESIIGIIMHLKNYAGTENAGVYTLTLNDSCKTLMAQQGVIEEFGRKTYDAYIADIGWNLA